MGESEKMKRRLGDRGERRWREGERKWKEEELVNEAGGERRKGGAVWERSGGMREREIVSGVEGQGERGSRDGKGGITNEG